MNPQAKMSYKFSKIPMLQVKRPTPLDVSRDLNRILAIKRTKKKRISDHMYESVIETRLKSARNYVQRDYPPVPSRPLTAKDFRKLSEQYTDSEMSEYQEKAIRERIEARGLEEHYSEFVDDYIKEVKLEYIKIIHYSGMNLKIKDCHPEGKFIVTPYKFVGKTARYKHFLTTQKMFENKWILHYPIIRKIQKECVLHLPSLLFEIHFMQVLSIENIEYEYKQLTQLGAQCVNEFYSKIGSIIEKEKNKRSGETDQCHFLRVATGVLTLHISSSITHTLEEIVQFTIAKDPKPYMFLDVTFTNQLVLEPTPEEAIEVYHNFIDNVLSIRNEIFDFETYQLRGNKRKAVNLYLTQGFINNCKEEIKININRQFEPILEYLNNINESLSIVYKDICSDEFFETIVDMVFEEGCKKINFYREYLDKVMFIPDFEFFRIAKVSFINYKKNLHAGLHKNIDLIFEKLSSQHLWEVNDLCETFEHVKMRAETRPETTEELIEIGRFMTWVRNEEFQTLENRVTDSLSALCKIIDLGTLEDEHMQLNAMSIQWLTDILPIMEEQAVTFDGLKYDAEEKLQKVVEDVSELVKKVFPLLVILDEMDDIDKVKISLNFITLHMKNIKEIESQIEWINQEEVTLSFPKSTYSEYEELKNYVYPFHHLLNVCLEVQQNLYSWQDGPFDMIDYEKTKIAVEKYQKELSDTYKTYRQKLRQAQDENISLRFKGTVDDPDILNWPAPLKLCGTALRRIEAFEPSVKVMKIVCNSCLRKRHWKAMSEIAGTDVTPNAGTTLRKIMQVDFFAKMEEYEIISIGATKEQQLLDQLNQLKKQWDNINFTVSKHRDYDITILIQLDEIETLITDHNTVIRNMKSSVFVTPHETEVKDFFNQISRVQETIENWYNVQNVLLKLYPIISLKELGKIIPKEAKLLENVIRTYNESIDLIIKDANVIKIIKGTDITKDLVNSIRNLEIVFVGVNTYLDNIRDYFPRFYFISNDEFIKAISNSKEILISQYFLSKLFQSVHHLEVNDKVIVGIVGNKSEKLKFKNNLEIEQTLETTFKKVEVEIISTIKEDIVECFKQFKKLELKDLLFKYCEQVLKVSSQCYWTENIEMALCINSDKNLEACFKNLEASIEEKIQMVREDVTNQERFKIKNIIVSEIYIKRLITKILNSKKISIYSFDWEVHFKYYLKNNIVKVNSMTYTMDYMYEYLGSYCHILTSSTDRYFRMLINTYHMNYSGLLQGQPDGGKFETVKTLAGIFGNFLVKFVCSQELRSTTLERFLKGSLLCGSWICFENFDDLEVSVMSGLSECLFNIRLAKKENLERCLIGTTSVNFNHTSFISICTTNHSYSDLPESLKKYFRTITMLQPDIDNITETVLYSVGFKTATVLSKKISCSFDLLQDVLSPKQNCHFGLSKLLRILEESEEFKIKNPNLTEDDVIFSAINKILQKEVASENSKEFHSVLHHLFPNSRLLTQKSMLNDKLKAICEEDNLKWSIQFGFKTVEVYECISNNRCVVLVGKTCNSKTTILKLCQKLSVTIDNQKLNLHFIVPNCYNYQSLYGYLSSPNEWVDGLVTTIFRENIDETALEKSWIIFDGDINPYCIDNIKPVHKEKRLYLQSGEVIKLGQLSRVAFEVDNLHNCSPAVVSHLTVIYIDQLIPVWQAIVASWTISCTSDWIQGIQQQVEDIFSWLIPPSLDFLKKNCRQLCELSEINLVKNLIAITQLYLDEVCSVNKKEEDLKNMFIWIQATIIQAGVLGLGALLDTNSRPKFDEFYKLLWRGQNESHPYPSSFGKLEVSIPHDGLLLEYQYIYKQRGNWKLHQDLLKTEKIIESPYMYQFLVPTADTIKYSHILTLCIKNKLPVLLFGPPCTGKTLLIEDVLRNRINEQTYEISHLNFNLYFDAQKAQRIILSKTNKRQHGIYSPPIGKNYIVFIDNLNQVSPDKYGNFSCIELLRQHMDHNVWYDYNNFSKITLNDSNFISAMGVPEGSKKILKLRFLRHFHVFGINEFTEETISRIYGNTLVYIWRQNGFPSDIGNVVSQLVEATLAIYKKILLNCRTTLTRSYYHFNMNSFANVINGCALLKKETYDSNKKIYIKLWIHEILRTFGDRLSTLDNNILENEVKEASNTYFNNDSVEEIVDVPINKIIMSTINDRDHQKYEEITDLRNIIDFLTDELNKYNYAHKIKINVCFFEYVLDKIFKISRVFSLTPGNSLFLGSTGLGRSVLTKLLTFVYEFKLFQPTVTKDYTTENWKGELKTVLKEAGAVENKSVFLVNEKDLIDEEFLQYIETLHQNGDITDIFNLEEKQEILELSRLSAQGGNRNLDISSASVFLHFNKCCKLNLHLILCLSINAKKLRIRLRNFQTLLNSQVIFWDDWPDEALQYVAEVMTRDVDMVHEDKTKSIETFIYFHRDFQLTARNFRTQLYISPSCFIHLIKLFMDAYTNEKKYIENKRKRFSQGLSKLSYAANQILDMQRVLAEYKPQLAEMTSKAIEMTEQIALETIEVEKASELVRQDEKIASEQATIAQILKSECEAELAQAIPILEDAISALNTLKPSDITLVKSMKNPPDAIKLVMAAVCVIKDVKPDRIPDPSTGRKTYDYWGPSKRILGDMNFLQTLKDFDKDNIKAEIMVKIRKEFLPHKDFKPHVVAKASSAAEGLCKWIIAMDMYDKVAKEVAPKKEKLRKAERDYAQTMAILNEKKEEVKRIEEKLAGLNALLEDANKKQLKLQREVDICNRKLASAQKLIGSLSEEQVRWNEAVENLEKQNELVLGNILLTTGIVAYLPFTNYITRNTITKKWRKYITEYTTCSDNFTMVQSFSSQLKINARKQGDFLRDDFFLQNILIYDFSQLFSIFIDPDYQANAWIKKIEQRNNLTVTTFSHEDFLDKLTSCITFGKPILIHQIKNSVPSCLYQFISKLNFIENENETENKFIFVNGKPVQLHARFRIYLVCNLNQPNFVPEMFNKLTVINFIVTSNYLKRHFLTTVTEIEKPEIRKLKKGVYIKKNQYRTDIFNTENEILETLCESETDILEDEASIKILEEYKILLKSLRDKYHNSELAENTIQDFMNLYHTVASFVANIYFCVCQLKSIDHIYQFSFDWFEYLYYQSIINAEKSRIITKKCDNINKNFILQLYKQLNYSLYEKDKFIVLVLLTIYVLKYKRKTSDEELILFLKDTPLSTSVHNFNEITWEILAELETLPAFHNFCSDFRTNFKCWQYISSNSNFRIPEPWNSKLTAFQKLILLKIFKPTDLYNSLKNIIRTELGSKFLETVQWNIDDIYNESYSLSPILFFHKGGNDFVEELYILLDKKKVTHTFRSYCLSDHSSSPTDLLLKEAQEKGFWLLFQNCHLDKLWLENLEKKLVEMNYENTSENFRLWLTAEPTKSIPLELLQNSIKVVYDYPGDFKQTVLKFLDKKYISEYFFSGCPGKQAFFTKFLYGLICFHSSLIRRKQYDSYFFNPPYDIKENDLKMSIKVLQLSIDQQHFSPEDAEKILYVIGNYQYGTQLGNASDVELINTLLSEFLSPAITKNRRYCFGNVRDYGLPKKCDYPDYLKLVRNLPEPDNVEIFGLGQELEVICDTMYCNKILTTVSDVVIVSQIDDIEDNEFRIISYIDDILTRIPKEIQLESCEDFIILNEISNYNNLLRMINKALVSVKQCLSGTKPMSTEIENIATDILKTRVPNSWKKLSYFGNTSLSEFVDNLEKRLNYFKTFKSCGNFWLAAFQFPKALFCKIKLDLSLKLQIPVESLDFSFEVLKNMEIFERDTFDDVVMTGLYVANAEWNIEHQYFYEISSKLYNTLPPILLKPNNISNCNDNKLSELALYQNCDLKLFVCTIKLPYLNKRKHWVKRGVKLLSHVSKTSEFNNYKTNFKHVAFESDFI